MTNQINAGSEVISEKEANDIFYKAFSETHRNEGRITEDYKPSTFVDPTPATPAPLEPEPATPATPAVEPSSVPAEPATPAVATPEPATPAAPAKQPQTLDEILAGFPEDKHDLVKTLISQRDLAEQKFRSTSGRLHQERRDKLQRERELQELRTRVAPKPQDPALAAQAKLDHDAANAQWNKVKEVEPTLADAVDARINARVRAITDDFEGKLDARVNPLYEHTEEDFRQAEWDKLVELVPNVGDVVRSPEYQYWIANVAPPGVRKLAEDSPRHEDSVVVLQNFAPYAQHLWDLRNPRQAAPAAPSPVAPSTPESTAQADAIADKRNSRPVAAVVPGGNPAMNIQPRRDILDQDMADKLFEEAYKKVKGK